MEDREGKVCPACGTRYDVAATFCQRDGSALIGAADEPDPYIGRTLLDQFEIQEVVGAGGMGTVYRARQPTIGRDVAIKILHPELVQNPDAVRRFQREARVSASLDHPNVVRVFLFGQLPDDSLYLVMEYLRGRSLLDVLRMDGVLDPARALHVVTQICDGVGEAHRQGVVHRDVKPENVLLVPRGQDPDFVKVLDFGIARFLRGEQTVATQSGLIFGTARYISPEGASGEPTDARSDVYSIAVLCYQLLCGETPFDAASPVGLLMKHIHDAPPDLRRKPLGRHVPGEVADVVMRALGKNPDTRPADANELGAALRAAACAADVDVASPRYSAAPASVRPGPVATPSPSPAPVRHGTPTPRTVPMGPASPTLGAAPSPFGDPSVSVQVKGVPGARRGLGAAATVLVAFVLGAAAVVGGAVLLGDAGGSGAVAVEELESRARAALARGDIDTPPGDNVADLTARILERDPDHGGALALRAEAARRLREEAATARAQGFLDEARARYRRSLALVPDEPRAVAALAEIEAASSAPARTDVAGIRVSPEEPAAGEPLTLVAVLGADEEVAADAEAYFHVERRGRRLTRPIAAELDDAGRYVGTYRFRGHGTFDLVFMTGEEVRLRRPLTVAPARSARRRDDPPATTQGGAPRPRAEPAVTMESTSGDGIDWRLPDERRDPAPPPTSTPAPEPDPDPDPDPEPVTPEPWTSGSLL